MERMKKLVYGALVFGAMSFAQDFKIYHLGQVEVSEDEEVDYNSSVESITQQSIEDTNSSNVAQALRYTTGIFYQPASSSRGEPFIGIRGYSSTQIGLFVDGIPISSIYDRQSDLSQYNTFGLSEISVSKGYTSPVYGMNTLGGAINIISSKPTQPFEASAKYQFISNNENQAYVSAGSKYENFYTQISYGFIHRDSLPLSSHFSPTKYQDKGEKLNSHYTNHTLKAKVGYEPNSNHEYSLNLIYQKGSKGGLLSASNGGRYWEWPHYDKLTLYALGSSHFSDSLSLETKLYYDSFYNQLNSLGKLEGVNGNTPIIKGGPKFTSIYDDYTLGGVVIVGYDFDWDKNLKTGINLKQDNHKNIDPSQGADPNTNISDLSTSIFAQYSQNVNSYFRFMISGSYDRNDVLNAKVEQENKQNKEKIIDTSKVHLQGFTLQSIGYIYFNDYVMMHLNIGQKSKLPTLKERYSTIFGNRTPNPSLQPESAINYEIGTSFDTHLENATLGSLSVFYNDLRNSLIAVPDSSNSCIAGANCQKLINAKEGYAYGVEFSIQQNFWEDKLSLLANYSFVKKEITQKDKQKENAGKFKVDGSKITGYPEHIFNFNLAFSPIADLRFNLNSTYQAGIYEIIDNQYKQINAIFLTDLKASYKIKGVEISAGVENIFDGNFYYGDGYYLSGRRYFVSLGYSY